MCGCTSARHSERPARPATPAELRWLGRLDRAYQPDADFADSCPISRDTSLGKPPAGRLRRYVALTTAACADFERGTNDPSAPQSKPRLDQALAVMRQANEIVDPLRPGMRPLPRIAGPSEQSRVAIGYTHAAAEIGGDGHAVVRCWSLPDWGRLVPRLAAYSGKRQVPADLLGFTIEPHFISLSPSACRSLDEFAYEHARPKDASGLAEIATGLNALAHESNHLRYPHSPEAVVECYGMQAIARTTRILGGSARYGHQVARFYFRDLYPEQPAGYRTVLCRNGGLLDRHLSVARWP